MEKEQKEQDQKKKEKITALFFKDAILTENTDSARELYNQSRFGDIEEDGKLHLSLIEAYYLLDKERLMLVDKRNHKISKEDFLKKATRTDPNFLTRYAVFKDLRNRGYIVKTALKFGADFRVYDRGVKPGEDHAKWVVYPVKEDAALTWYDFAAKNRVAHSTKKRLLLGVVDDEGDVSYWECRWIRP
jgi:tRNA-intron endonuclease